MCTTEQSPLCATLTAAAGAIETTNIDALVSLSASRVVDCEDVDPATYTDCFDAKTAEGYAIDAGDDTVVLLDENQYRSFLSQLEQVAPNVSDDRGSGEVDVYGLGIEGNGYELLATALIDDLLGPGTPTRYVIALRFEEVEGRWALVHFFVQPVNVLIAQGLRDPYLDVSENVQPWP
ncbi:MAG TPA: hypothetical protein VFZ12_06895 [Dehalococcoidia bacterium]|nr:hypothetical protein [Dehalococcoidia bacterium]